MKRTLNFLIALFVSAALGDASAQTIGLSYGSVGAVSCDNTALFGVPVYTCLRNWYLAPPPTGNDSTGNGSSGSPWATIAKADQNTVAGDCVNLAAGTYSIQNQFGMHGGGNANTSTGYVVYRGPTPGVRPTAGGANTARLQATSGGNLSNASLVWVVLGNNSGNTCGGNNSACPGANYVIFDGIEFDGNHIANGECVGPFPPGQHHIVYENNVVHGCGTGDLRIGGGDYVWIVNNLAYDCCAADAVVEGSGISVYEPTLATYAYPSFTPNAADNALTYKVVIANNVLHDNLIGPSGCVYGQTGSGAFAVASASSNTITINSPPAWISTANGNLFIKDNTHSNYLTPYARITNVAGGVLTLSQTPSGSMAGDSITIACGTNWGSSHTDADGIILDDWSHSQNGIGSTPYCGPAIVVGNMAYGNGGAGILAYSSTASNASCTPTTSSITIANNSAYNNYTDVQNTSTNRGEVNCVTCSNLTSRTTPHWRWLVARHQPVIMFLHSRTEHLHPTRGRTTSATRARAA